MSLTFYTNPMSRGQIARWMLEEIGQPYDTVLLDFTTTMKAEPYLSINPMGKVPTVVHDGRVVTECAAVCAYLADTFPAAGLAPPTNDRADYYRWLFFAAGPLEQAVTNQALGVAPTAAQGAMVGYGSFDKTVDVLARHLAGRSFVAGERFSAADVYVGSQVLWGLQFGTLPKRPAFEAYGAGLAERPAYRRAKAIDGALIAAASKAAG